MTQTRADKSQKSRRDTSAVKLAPQEQARELWPFKNGSSWTLAERRPA